jgi:hypothetical protein
MFPLLLTSASRQTALLLAWLLLCTGAAYGRDFTVQTLSDPKGNARIPSIGETGLVAWQGYSFRGGNPLSVTTDTTAQRYDIFIWRDGQATNMSSSDIRIIGADRPHVFRDSVLFTAWYAPGAVEGYPYTLSVPVKNEEMREKESEYPGLFDPPLAGLKTKSALEAEALAADTNTPPDESTPTNATKWIYPEYQAVDPHLDPTNLVAFQFQQWRHSGNAEDIAVYHPDGRIERITPGGVHFSMPVMSEAGIAFQLARGWPYGYEMMAWKPGATNLIQLTTNYFYVLNADVQGNDLVFQAWDGDDYEIFLYRFDTGEMKQITNNQFDDIAPVVWNGQIAWIAHPTVTAEIFLMSEGAIRKISEGTEDNGAPSIWEGKVVWQGYDDTDLEIYYFNGRRTIKLTSNTWDDMAPKVRDGLITWMSYVDNWDSEIMVLDLGDNTPVQLTDNDMEDSFPQTAGEKIVWQTVSSEGSIVQLASPNAPRAAPTE